MRLMPITTHRGNCHFHLSPCHCHKSRSRSLLTNSYMDFQNNPHTLVRKAYNSTRNRRGFGSSTRHSCILCNRIHAWTCRKFHSILLTDASGTQHSSRHTERCHSLSLQVFDKSSSLFTPPAQEFIMAIIFILAVFIFNIFHYFHSLWVKLIRTEQT